MWRRLFPNLTHLGPEELMVMPFALFAALSLFVSGLVYIGDRMGMAYGERANPPAPDCKNRPRLDLCVNPYTGEPVEWTGYGRK